MIYALAPVFSLILIGIALRRFEFLGAEFWRGAERLTYYLLFPALLFLKLSLINVSDEIELSHLALLLILMLVATSLLLFMLGYVFNIRAAAFTSLFQGGIRFNTYVGLAVVNGLLGDNGLAIAAIVIGVMIPVVNLLCISVFAFSGCDDEVSFASIAKNILTNPLILSCLLGILWNKVGWILPGIFVSVLELLSSAALPLGLLAVGAGVQVSVLGSSIKPLFISSAVKLVVSPLLAFVLCVLFSVGSVVTLVVVIIFSLPTASSAYILSKELGGDSNVMAAIITGQTLMAMISMSVAISFFT
jgi:predicted permease